MARVAERLPQNAPGAFFVDRSCIDCDTCRQVAPDVFARSAEVEQSFVKRQPADEEGRMRALMALVACPTSSIGTADRADVAAAVRSYPEPIAGGVHFCGFTAESSFGAWSYLIRRPGGNVLVDSPRAARPLVKRLRELGGVDLMFLTHRDDVADHQTFHDELGCRRILHAGDVTPGTAGVEQQVKGDEPVALAPDLTAIPVPGHTRGSMALLYAPEDGSEAFLFSGDHVWWSEGRGRLNASRGVCWYSWSEQLRSVGRLLDFSFTWLLPGHGRRYRASSAEGMRCQIANLLSSLRGD